ncbi:hypothetical protein K227x_53130 [Rubripirellula lacrimiformis]|uniref:Uncharacterized protein n=1 Tax=Rubripirellula lacrimiformis TaxID=1930273 RepID=A0A517NID1_9BACT|nr:hypothetical protein [Rubripirellula lacrimiformis]QDT06890.1 hypothetical protein K227x_53130 [Rubripirellula lacrimiformis]
MVTPSTPAASLNAALFDPDDLQLAETLRPASNSRESAGRQFEELAMIEPRLRNIAADASSSRWSVARYEGLKRRAARLVGWHAANPLLASSRCYEVVVWHLAGLLRSRRRAK